MPGWQGQVGGIWRDHRRATRCGNFRLPASAISDPRGRRETTGRDPGASPMRAAAGMLASPPACKRRDRTVEGFTLGGIFCKIRRAATGRQRH